MDRSVDEARKAIDQYKPLFEYARMILTFYAMLGVFFVIWRVKVPPVEGYADELLGWLQYLALAVVGLLTVLCSLAIYKTNQRFFVILEHANDLFLPKPIRVVLSAILGLSFGAFPGWLLIAMTLPIG